MNNKKLLISLVVIVIGVVIIVLLDSQVRNRTSQLDNSTSDSSETGEIDSQAEATTGTEKQGVTRAPKGDEGLTYQQVVEKYKDFRIQFNNQCAPLPSSVTYKNGSRVMFDNRSVSERSISLDGKAYKISTYGFIVLPLSAKTLPHTIKIDCDQQYNAGQILLQR